MLNFDKSSLIKIDIVELITQVKSDSVKYQVLGLKYKV